MPHGLPRKIRIAFLLQAVLAKQEAWEYVTFQDEAEMPLAFKAPSTVLA